jgi:hypothetical protein
VKIEVTHVAAELTRRCDAHERIHVCAVDVHAAAEVVDDPAKLLHLHFEHAVR